MSGFAGFAVDTWSWLAAFTGAVSLDDSRGLPSPSLTVSVNNVRVVLTSGLM